MDYKALFIGILGTALFEIIKYIVTYFVMYRFSKYSGIWDEDIYDDNGQIIKKDIVKLKHHKLNNFLTGEIERIYPNSDNYKRWKCRGIMQNKNIILCFWTEDAMQSDGCAYALLTDDYTFERYYLRNKDRIIKQVRLKAKKRNRRKILFKKNW